MHKVIREQAMTAWARLQSKGMGENPLLQLLSQDTRVRAYLSAKQVSELLDASAYVGDAPERAKALAETILKSISASF
jgi:adenylosuccinate lyase